MLGCKSGNDKSGNETPAVNNATLANNSNSNDPVAGKTTASNTAAKEKKGKVSSVMNVGSEKESTEAVPQYPGGQAALDKFITDNIEYPSEALDAGIEGTVTVELAFDENGKIYTQRLESTQLGYGLADAVMCAIKKMPMWKPGMIKGKNTKAKYNFPVHFQLSA